MSVDSASLLRAVLDDHETDHRSGMHDLYSRLARVPALVTGGSYHSFIAVFKAVLRESDDELLLKGERSQELERALKEAFPCVPGDVAEKVIIKAVEILKAACTAAVADETDSAEDPEERESAALLQPFGGRIRQRAVRGPATVTYSGR